MTLVTIYLHCAVLFASHPWVLVDRPPSCKDTTRETKKNKTNIFGVEIMDKMSCQIFIVQNINDITKQLTS